jgi:hypothetical protein
MNYAVKILKEEKYRLVKALNYWDEEKYPEARKERANRIKEINQVLELIKNAKQ